MELEFDRHWTKKQREFRYKLYKTLENVTASFEDSLIQIRPCRPFQGDVFGVWVQFIGNVKEDEKDLLIFKEKESFVDRFLYGIFNADTLTIEILFGPEKDTTQQSHWIEYKRFRTEKGMLDYITKHISPAWVASFYL